MFDRKSYMREYVKNWRKRNRDKASEYDRNFTSKPINDEFIEDFYSHINKTDSCWIWTGAFMTSGYGFFRGKTAHKLSYIINKGDVPDGLFVLHSCHNRKCCNPEHLRIGTPEENSQDMIKAGRAGWQKT